MGASPRANLRSLTRSSRVPEPARDVVLDPSAEAEARAAFLWYVQRNPRAADEFQAAFERALAEVAEAPMRWPEFQQGTRRRSLGKFPYSLIYDVTEDRIVILAVMHHRRKPGYWKPRKAL